MIKKLLFAMLIFSLMLGAVCAVNFDDLSYPESLHKVTDGGYADDMGRGFSILNDTPMLHAVWFKNTTGYVVKPSDLDDRYYMFFDNNAGQIGVLEVIELDGVNYIVNSHGKNGPGDVYTLIWNVVEFNNLNNLTPIAI